MLISVSWFYLYGLFLWCGPDVGGVRSATFLPLSFHWWVDFLGFALWHYHAMTYGVVLVVMVVLQPWIVYYHYKVLSSMSNT